MWKQRHNLKNDIFNHYTFSIPQTLSLGAWADISLSSITENKTEITIEIRRKLGTFDKSSEITFANYDIVALIEHISKLIILSDAELLALHPKVLPQKLISKRTTLIFAVCLGLFGGHRFYTQKPNTGILQLFTLGFYGLWTAFDIYKILTNS